MGEENILLPGLEGFMYKGPTYLELNKKLKSNPLVYNLIQQNIARKNNPTKEIVSYVDANRNTLHTTNVSAGVLSPVDPLAELYVAGKVLDPAFKLAGRAGEYGMARLGNNWARARILSRNIDNAASKFTYPAYEFLLPTLTFKPTKQSLGRTYFERPLSRISLAERMGIPKGERNLPFKAKVPTSHVQGLEAVKMFKEYGGEPIPEGSINGKQLRKYVAEARERYGLVNNKNITDEEIAQALYKHVKELGGNTAAVNAQGEPLLLFRGDTKRFTEFKPKMSPEELSNKRGTMDNSLGNLFLGEFPYEFRGVDRYIGTWRNFRGNGTLFGSGTGSKVKFNGQIGTSIEGFPYIGSEIGGYKLYSHPHSKTGDILTVYKLPSTMMDSGVNDLNAFVVRTPAVRDATPEISVLNDDWLALGAQGSTPHMRTKLIYDKDGFPLYQHPDGTTTFALAGIDNRPGMAEHYRYVLDDAAKKGEGLLRSNKNAPLRDEHSNYTYFALPNFNLRGIKHLLPYDLRIPRNWKDRNFYRTVVPLTVGGITLHEITNLKQGGKMNILQFLKNGSGIHIKKENRGKFTDYCGGKVTSECIAKGKRSSNPAIRKRATFAANVRKWKHEDGGRVKKHLAFVNGVSILDSNPDAYKYVKKKLHKAADGGNSKNWFSGVGNWLNKNLNTISTIGSTIMNGVGLLKQNSELSKAKAAKEKELNAKYNPNNLINDSEIWNEVNNQISLLELLNPDVHYGDIDKLNLYKKIKNSYLSQARLYTLAAKLLELLQYNLYISDAQTGNTSSLMDLIGNGISTGIGMLGNKSTTTAAPTGTTTTSYSSYAPGYTPSMPKTFSEYAALNYKK